MTPRSVFTALFSFITCTALAQVSSVRLEVYVPDSITNNKQVYVSGTFNRWLANDSLYRMHKEAGNLYTLTLPVFRKVKYEYKYTLGSWANVEVAANDSSIHNRNFIATGKKARISDTVAKWSIPKPAAPPPPQAQHLMKMKDSVLSALQPKLAELQVILKQFANNLLQDKPDAAVDKEIADKMTAHFADFFSKITLLYKSAAQLLSKEQKQEILKALNDPQQKDVLNTFINGFGSALEKQGVQ